MPVREILRHVTLTNSYPVASHIRKDLAIEPRVIFSEHAAKRLAERNVYPHEVEYTIRFGLREYNAGSVLYYLAKRSIPESDLRNQRIAQLEGLAVLADQHRRDELHVITIYRNREEALKDHRRKTKYARRKAA